MLSSACKDYGTTPLHDAPDQAIHVENWQLNGPKILKERTVNSAKVFNYTYLFDAVVARPTRLY
ncbi:unnamed protein product [Fusarium graminearum]|nr:unnamed protein product [Fusarium graminearum]CAG1980960.1 unnamed protein product [Fusarium graminearum]VTO84385.1 unnamed protein product [Fusarium graminearum]